MVRTRQMWLVLAATALFAGACTSPAPAPTAPSQPGPSPTAAPATPTPGAGGAGAAPTAAIPTPANTAPDPTRGRTSFTAAGCGACHGATGQGGVFPGAPKLSGTTLTADQVKAQVRNPRDASKGMPPFGATAISDNAINDVYAWVKTNP